MDFTSEYHALKKLDPNLTYIARYKFNNEAIRLYVRFHPKNQYLIVTTDDMTRSLVHPFNIIQTAQGKYTINGFWGQDIAAAWPLAVERKFDSFYSSIKAAIHVLTKHGTDKIAIYTVKPSEVKLPTHISNLHQTMNGENIYFWYVKSSGHISKNQKDKIKELLGKDAFKFLEQNKLTAVFTDDPRKQKKLAFTP